MHMMIDLETMGTRPNAPILAIGGVAFDSNGIHDERYATVEFETAIDEGGVICPHTVMWWMKQSDEARAELTKEEGGMSIAWALKDFRTWFDSTAYKHGCSGVWGNGASFDNVILAESYRRMKMAVPWPFWKDKCYRTVKNMYPGVEFDRSGTHHNALDDAKTQAEHLIRINKAAGGIIL